MSARQSLVVNLFGEQLTSKVFSITTEPQFAYRLANPELPEDRLAFDMGHNVRFVIGQSVKILFKHRLPLDTSKPVSKFHARLIDGAKVIDLQLDTATLSRDEDGYAISGFIPVGVP